MEVAESAEQTSSGPTGADFTMANGERHPFLDDPLMDDGRSSSLSEIDDVSDNEPSDFEEDLIQPEKQLENDSEAETERLEDSPHNIRKRGDIVLSAGVGSAGPSPSKLHQSTTLADVDDDDDEEEEEEDEDEEDDHIVDDSPSKPRRSSNNNGLTDDIPNLDEVELPDSIGKKRKRVEAGDGDDTGTEPGDEEPLKKRRSSIKSDLSDAIDDDTPLSPEPIEDPSATVEDGLPADEVPESDLPAPIAKSNRGKKGKRRGRRGLGGETAIEDAADENLGEDEEPTGPGDEANDAETTARLEEESAKKTSAMESLATLEKEFATLRDKIYDERITKLNRELEMLSGSNPTHPEYLRQIECVERYRDAKINYERTLYRYRIRALVNRSLAERAQAHSTYFQHIRDVRERHSSSISKQFYAIQHDRFKTDEMSPHHIIPFPTRRSQQIAHQAAYNQEVSVMAGVAKYVGFPAAPNLAGARPSELDDDLEKMGITIETQVPIQRRSSVLPPRGTMPAMSSNIYRTAAEEAFLEQTPWANPQHPIHQQQPQHQYSQHHRPQAQANPYEVPQSSSYATPAAQRRVVDINAPNGSASTIPENASAANSSANNTPYGTEQDPRHQTQTSFHNPDYDIERKSGFRSQSSSPLDVRKAHPHSVLERRSPMHNSLSRHPDFSPPPARAGLFQPPAHNPDTSPTLSTKPVDSLHYRPHSELSTGPGPSHMSTR
ncbi:hypothetical protein N7478_002528 [Penicillium angulare]|uniref:uncharacterized protein n=1 Tax=Penicillium angulare TaxID=116970 RepID=UPI0025404F69|nr:uncharacterized protein N7478_002528 [Penicillium angulare]KAJ5286842.1 hypothetical protein N7478_002528 [Penicillium angulare]